MSANIKQAVPFFRVTDMESSLRFYVGGLGFTIKRQWVPEGGEHYPSDGKIRWCWLELGGAAIMLQEFIPQRRPKGAARNRSFGLLHVRRPHSAFIANSNQGAFQLVIVPLWGTVCGLYLLPILTAIAWSFPVPPMHRKKAS